MSMSDPTSPEVMFSESGLGEVTVEETAALDALDAAAGDPTAAGDEALASSAQAAAPVPIPLPLRPVSGRYRGTLGAFQLELRVDVDRTRPMKKLSGDYYQISGGTTTYFGSFIVNSPTVTVTATEVIISGTGTYTFATGYPVIRVTIPRRNILQPQAPATARYYSTSGTPGAVYTCAFESIYFRTIQIETDRVSDVVTPVFSNYNTGSLPSGGPARNLSVVGAFAEAGLQMISTAASNVINITEAGASWSNAELHASMERHFSLWRDLPQWAVWLVAAQKHDLGSGLLGIMFDQQGKQRQGCAVFHQGIGGTTSDKLRLQLYTYVHELGHCFNLLHSWQKSYASPSVPNRPNSLSFMNYPWGYPAGQAAFWNNFAFQFDNEEVIHLRHAFRNNIVMGGNNFAVGAALGREVMADPIRDESGLNLTISTHQPNFALGEPVVLELALGSTDARGRRAHTWLHPNCGRVKVIISKPNGQVVAYEPLIDHLVGERERIITQGDPERDSAYIGFGKDGFYFDQPGHYRIRAAYAALDGSEVFSNILTVRVRYPVTEKEEDLADKFMGEDQGTLLYLLGSDSEDLRRGNAAFDEVLEKYANHPMANYARLVKGMNLSRDFKLISDNYQEPVSVRPAKLKESAKCLALAAESGVIDPLSTQMTLQNLAEVQTKEGDGKAAKKTRDTLATMTGKIATAAGS